MKQRCEMGLLVLAGAVIGVVAAAVVVMRRRRGCCEAEADQAREPQTDGSPGWD